MWLKRQQPIILQLKGVHQINKIFTKALLCRRRQPIQNFLDGLGVDSFP